MLVVHTIFVNNCQTENIQPVMEAALAKDYAAMLADELMVGDSLRFEQLLDVCGDLEAIINKSRVSPR